MRAFGIIPSMVRILLFASLAETYGSSHVELPATVGDTASGIFRSLTSRCPQLAEYRSITRIAVNEEYAGWDHPIKSGDEVAFFPPVSGGICDD